MLRLAPALLALAGCVFGDCAVFRSSRFSGRISAEVAAALHDPGTQWMLFVCAGIYLVAFAGIRWRGGGEDPGDCRENAQRDFPGFWLLGLVAVAALLYGLDYAQACKSTQALTLVGAAMVGQGIRFAICDLGFTNERHGSKIAKEQAWLLAGLVALLAFASWWHLDMSNNFYRGPRWMGLWDNPNTYGTLMGAGTTLAIALLVLSLKSNSDKSRAGVQSPKPGKMRRFKIIFLSIAIVMLGVALVMSYSRGAWLATGIGLLYLAWCYGKLKWRPVLPVVAVVAVVALYFWGRTPDDAPWYVKRADLGRPSAQNRVTAWRAGFQIMWDHPLGVGWNNAVNAYEKSYSPPEGGAGALTTNDYLMLGAQLGWPGLICFVAYVALCLSTERPRPPLNPGWGRLVLTRFRGGRWLRGRTHERGGDSLSPLRQCGCATKAGTSRPRPVPKVSHTGEACRAAALVFVVAFWFDGGLFKLPIAAVFWTLLELATNRNSANDEPGT